jgi:DNA-binding PadR family transcriptional regulator
MKKLYQSGGQRYGETTREILDYLVLAGAITIAATSPYFLVSLARAILKNKKYFKKKLEDYKIARALNRLKKNRLIILRELENDRLVVELTEKGKRLVREIKVDELSIEKPGTWDKKWRVVIFDIPDETKRRARDALRDKLKNLGFYQLQKSVWAFPYPCEKEVQFLCELFEITPFVNLIVAESIYNDVWLRKHFQLLSF